MSTISAGVTVPTALNLSGDTTGALTFQVSGTVTAATISSAGNFGIGTASPGVRLDVAAAQGTTIRINNTTSAGTSGNAAYSVINCPNDNAGNFYRAHIATSDNGSTYDWGIGNFGTTTKNVLAFYSGGLTERMRIDSSGNVGIGTSSPGSFDPSADNLVVGGGSGDTGISIYSGTTGSGRLMFADGTSGDGPYVGQIHYDHSSNYMRFITNGGERARITSDGAVLVGTTTADGIISAERSGSNVITAKQNSAGGWCYKSNAFNNGGTYFHIEFLEQGTARGSIQSNGTNTSYNTTSDQRLKENIAPADDAGALVDAIQIVKHDWKAGGHTRYGVIAQDLYEIVPEAVAKGDDGNEVERPWGVDYSKLVPILVKAMQEQQEQIKALQDKVAALESK